MLSGGNGPITHFGSAGFTLSGKGTTNRDKACKLLFATSLTTRTGNNPACSGDNTKESYGNLGVSDRIITLPKVAERTTETALKENGAKKLDHLNTQAITSLDSLENGAHYTDNSLTIINATTLKPGQHLTIVALGTGSNKKTVFINGNIEVNPANVYTSLKDIPSLTIIADNIIVAGVVLGSSNPVTSIYGTYIAKDRFSTCTHQYKADSTNPNSFTKNSNNGKTSNAFAGLASASDPITNGSGICQDQLTVNGAVISKERPDLLRTHGAGKDDYAIPSEIFNYTPNLYLTPYANSINDGSNDWWLTDLRQLPARL